MDLLDRNDLVNSQTVTDIDPSESFFNSEFQFSDELFDEYSNEEHRAARRKRGLFSLIASVTVGIVKVVKAGKKAHELIEKSKKVKRAIERGKELYKEGKEIYDQGKEAYDKGKEKLEKGKKRYHEIKDKINGEINYWNGTIQGVKGEVKEWDKKVNCIEGKLKADAEAIGNKFTGKKGNETDWCGEAVNPGGVGGGGGGVGPGGVGGVDGVGGTVQEDPIAADVAETLDIVKQNNELLQQNSIDINRNFDAIQENGRNIDRNYGAIQENGRNIDRNYQEIKANGLMIEKNFDAIQANAKSIDRNYEAIRAVEYTINKNFEVQLKKFESIQRTMTEALDTLQEVKVDIVDRIAQAEKTINEHTDDVVRRQTYSGLKDCYDYFIDESNRIRALKIEQRIVQLEKPNGIMQTLQEHKQPGATSMYSLLSKIIQDNYAMPRDKSDEMAFAMLEELCYGMQVYTLIIYFLMEQYGILSESYYFKSDIDQYNHYYQLSYDSFKEFELTLVGSGKFLDKVTNVINQVKSIDFVKSERPEIFDFCTESLKNLQGIRDALTQLDQTFDPDMPDKMEPMLDFESSDVEIPNKMNQQWLPDVKLYYAVQFVGNDSLISSFISGWSDEYELDDVGHPVVTIPNDPLGRSRAIFRKIGKDQSQLVAVVKESSVTSFQDINRELFDAARQKNPSKALKRVAFYIEHGADVNARLEHDRRPIHVAADNGVWNIAKLLIQNGSAIDVQDENGYSPLYIVTESGKREFVQKLVELGANVNLRISKEHFELAPLHCAAYKGHLEIVQSLLNSSSVEVNARTTKGQTPLHYAASFCREDIVGLLLKHNGTDVNAQTPQQLTPLHLASVNNCVKVVQKLAEEKALNVSAATDQDVTPLHLASTYGGVDVAKLLVNMGAKTSGKTYQGASVLHHAAFGGNSEIVSLLTSNGANANDLNDLDRPPLYLACQFGHLEAAEKLIKSCANINLPLSKGRTMLHLAAINGDHMAAVNLIKLKISLSATDDYGRTALHYAVAYNYLSIAYVLLKAGADPNIKDNNQQPLIHLTGLLEDEDAAFNMIQMLADYKADLEIVNTAKLNERILHIFCKIGYLKVVQFLVLEKKVNINANQYRYIDIDQGKTSLHFSVLNDHFEIVKFLLDNGADVNAKSTDGDGTPIHCAAQNGNLELLEYLIEKGADLDAKIPDNITPLHYAAQNGHLEIVKYLIEKGVDINARTRYGKTPLHYAAKGRASVELVEHLLKSGADIKLNTYDIDDGTCVHRALNSKNFKIAKFLIENGGTYKSISTKFSVFIWACKMGADVNFMKYLVAKEGVSIHKVKFTDSDKPFNAIDFAVSGDGDVELIRYLIDDLKIELDHNPEDDDDGPYDEDDYDYEMAVKDWQDGIDGVHRHEDYHLLGPVESREALIKQEEKMREEEEKRKHLPKPTKPPKYHFKDNSHSINLIHSAAYHGKLDIVRYFAEEKGVDCNSAVSDGKLPLHTAAMQNHTEIVAYLLNKTSNVDTKDGADKSALDYALFDAKNLEMVKLLQSNGADINQFKAERIEEHISSVIKEDRHDLANYLLSNTEYDMAKSLLHFAVELDDIEYIYSLLVKGADYNKKDGNGKTPIDLMIDEKKYDAIKFFLFYYKDQDGTTVMHHKAREGDSDRVKFLVERGGNVNAQNDDGETPVHFAVREGHLEVVKLLAEHNCADISIKNSKGETAQDVAQSDVADYLKGKSRRRRYVHEFDTEKPVKSSAVRPSWWFADAIGGLLNGFKTLAEDVSQFLSKSNLAQFPPQMPKSNSLVLDQNFDVNGTILLLDLLVRSKTGQKYLSFGAQSSITPVKARTYALNLIDKFESLLIESSNDQLVLEQFDSFKLFQTIESYAISEQFDKIEQTLNSFVLKTFDRIDSKLLARQINRLLIETQLEGSQSQQICNSKFSISTKSNIDLNLNYIGFEKHELI